MYVYPEVNSTLFNEAYCQESMSTTAALLSSVFCLTVSLPLLVHFSFVRANYTTTSNLENDDSHNFVT